ncbi:pyrroline-5-carboxylate reductase [Conexibacter sp. DBS9H8]|uniref:pyrroline-5-carboxylate reductase family protein n=1 Tax=Conexibacter sp. DBS9H8 TaxID=2937801 RepID=UPI00200F26AB|nr:pyrroline-5-carboxylate reductase [Conexibacter sp. DBS9H8]
MVIGLIGAGNMARALARGWGRPVLVSDAGSGRAQAIVDEVGGERVSNLEAAQRADVLVLAHKPHQLAQVAAEISGAATTVVSVLGATPTAALRAALPGARCFAIMPNTPVEVQRGAIVYAADPEADPAVEATILGLFRELGVVVSVPEGLLDAATSLSGVGPAYQALLAEAQIDAGIRLGLRPWDAENLVIETMAGTAELLLRRNRDTLAVRREVTSPGGSTARGLAALEAAGLRSAFHQAADAVVGPSRK